MDDKVPATAVQGGDVEITQDRSPLSHYMRDQMDDRMRSSACGHDGNRANAVICAKWTSKSASRSRRRNSVPGHPARSGTSARSPFSSAWTIRLRNPIRPCKASRPHSPTDALTGSYGSNGEFKYPKISRISRKFTPAPLASVRATTRRTFHRHRQNMFAETSRANTPHRRHQTRLALS